MQLGELIQQLTDIANSAEMAGETDVDVWTVGGDGFTVTRIELCDGDTEEDDEYVLIEIQKES